MSLLHGFQVGGIFMYFILVFGLFTLGFIVERSVALYGKAKLAPQGLRRQLLPFLHKGDLEGAASYLKTLPPQSVIRIASTACEGRAHGVGEEELQSRIDEAIGEEIHRLGRRTGFLAMFGNVATLLGLLGTISGMIRSFAAVASSSPAERAMLLSRGISEAMNCTAFGLVVAIPALVAYAIFQNKTDRLTSDLIETVSKIYHDLIYLYEPGGVTVGSRR
jgi:biopolymer transport protein ExbB/TolQ